MADPEGFTLLPYTDTSGPEPIETSVYVTTLPKGTVLFRGVRTLDKLYDDVYGLQTKDGPYCLPPEYNVFFYPFPFADATVGSYSHVLVYVTMHDIKLATFLSPSPMIRGDRHQGTGPIIACDKIASHGCGIAGRRYDPCFKPDFRAAHPDVSGMIGIADVDRREFLNTANNAFQGAPLRKYFNQYVSAYTDSTGKPGIPEVILHPLVTRGAADTMTPGDTDIDAWYDTHTDTASYSVWRVLPRDDGEILEFLQASTGAGLGGLRVKLDTRTGFYVREADADAETRPHLVDLRAEGGDWAMTRDTPGFRFQRGAIEVELSFEELEAKTTALRERLATVIRETRPRTPYANRMAHALAEALLRVMLVTLGYYTRFDVDGLHEVDHDTICGEGHLKACGSMMDAALATLTYAEEEAEEVVGETKDFDVKLRYPIDNTVHGEPEVFAEWQDIIRDKLLDASFDPATGLYDRPRMLESAAQLVSRLFRGSVNLARKTMLGRHETDEPARDFLTKGLEEVERLLVEHNDYGEPGWVNIAFDHPYEDRRWVDWTDEDEEGEGEPEWGGEEAEGEAEEEGAEEEGEAEAEPAAEEKPPTGARRRHTYRRRATSLRRR